MGKGWNGEILRVTKKLKALGNGGRNAARRAMMDVMKPVQAKARDLVPVDTSALKKSLARETRYDGQTEIISRVGPNPKFIYRGKKSKETKIVNGRRKKVVRRDKDGKPIYTLRNAKRPILYARIIEEGGMTARGGRIRPQPYVRPAWYANRASLPRALARAMKFVLQVQLKAIRSGQKPALVKRRMLAQ